MILVVDNKIWIFISITVAPSDNLERCIAIVPKHNFLSTERLLSTERFLKIGKMDKS